MLGILFSKTVVCKKAWCLRHSLPYRFRCKQLRATYPNAKLRRDQPRATYTPRQIIVFIVFLVFLVFLVKAGGLSRADTERAWRALYW